MTRHDQGTEASHDPWATVKRRVMSDWPQELCGAGVDIMVYRAEDVDRARAADRAEIARLTQERDALAAQIAGLREALRGIVKLGPRCDECSRTHWVIQTAEDALNGGK